MEKLAGERKAGASDNAMDGSNRRIRDLFTLAALKLPHHQCQQYNSHPECRFRPVPHGDCRIGYW